MANGNSYTVEAQHAAGWKRVNTHGDKRLPCIWIDEREVGSNNSQHGVFCGRQRLVGAVWWRVVANIDHKRTSSCAPIAIANVVCNQGDTREVVGWRKCQRAIAVNYDGSLRRGYRRADHC